ncbi:proteoglycan 4b isoform X2 [Plectropomus leopardus]|uniref:proteoglycan 4b isoform X2 n=1 Tax=Plectropomus leopardus TaxID=160734 RepID=UPI001C4C1CEC|nr:proteoglycan 4b isoform X2 [Plectropomus leopardus]
MSSTVLCVVILLACALAFSAAQTSCKGRCGAEYNRGNLCQCDYNCLFYGECCKDFESQCTTKNSCMGRCGENFRRGRLCNCDSDCTKFKQCCPDYKSHCNAEEEISGATSETAPGKTSSCDNVNDNKPKEPLTEATEFPTFSEGNNADDLLIPLVSQTSYQQDVPSDDTYSQIFPKDEFSNDGVKGPEASPIPESTSGYGSSTADLLDQISTEPTKEPDALEFSTETFTALFQTQTTLSDNEPTQTDNSPIIEEAPTESTDTSDATSSSDAGTTLPQYSTAADHVSSPTTPTTAPQTEYSPTANTPELGTVGQAEVQPEDPTVASSDEPKATTLPVSTPPVSTGTPQGSSSVLENSQFTTISASSTLDSTSVPETTTSIPGPDDTVNTDTGTPSSLADPEYPSTSVSPAGPGDMPDPDTLTTNTPTTTNTDQDDTTADITQGVTTDGSLNVTPDPTKAPEATSKPQSKPYKPLPAKPAPAKPAPAKPAPVKPTPAKPAPVKPTPAKPTLAKPSKPETKPLDTTQTLNIDYPRDYQADDNNDTNLCSERPVSAVTTLRNGTMVVFRGHYFWVLDRNMVPGPARGITQVWGVPSPIDTVFTRCNCQGKTYIFKGSQYWRFENGVLDPNYPKVIETGFDGLRGHITAALSVPQYQMRGESVYFFKRGGVVQKYSYQFGTSPTCGRRVQHAVYTVHNRMVRQAVSSLSPAINIRTSWKGFPSTVTAAVSVPNNREPEGYKYYVFSRSKSYNVRMDRGRPFIAAPTASTSPQSNNFFKCQKKV